VRVSRVGKAITATSFTHIQRYTLNRTSISLSGKPVVIARDKAHAIIYHMIAMPYENPKNPLGNKAFNDVLDEGHDSINFCGRMASDYGLHACITLQKTDVFSQDLGKPYSLYQFRDSCSQRF